MAEVETYEILAIKYAEMTERVRGNNFINDDDHASPMPIDFYVWVIRNQNRTILVDTGFDHTEAARRGRAITLTPREALKRLDIDAETLDTLIVSHLHFDHAGTLYDFPAAQFHLQEAEMAYATGRCMCSETLKHPFTADHVCEMVRNVYSGRVRFHNGTGEVAPGITVHHSPGHSKGMQSVRVLTESGWVVLAVDAAHFYENFEKRKPFVIAHSIEDMLTTFDQLEDLASSPEHVIPGHDPLVFERYPALSADTQGFVHRLDRGRG
ncbi:MAG: N-acyl homoserine lactonase family protein [Pseudomonadota bacterium]